MSNKVEVCESLKLRKNCCFQTSQESSLSTKKGEVRDEEGGKKRKAGKFTLQ